MYNFIHTLRYILYKYTQVYHFLHTLRCMISYVQFFRHRMLTHVAFSAHKFAQHIEQIVDTLFCAVRYRPRQGMVRGIGYGILPHPIPIPVPFRLCKSYRVRYRVRYTSWLYPYPYLFNRPAVSYRTRTCTAPSKTWPWPEIPVRIAWSVLDERPRHSRAPRTTPVNMNSTFIYMLLHVA